MPETDSRVVFAQQHLDKMAADLKRLQERSETRLVAWQAASQAKAACEDWLKDGKPSGVLLEDFEGPEPTLNKGEDVLSAIERLRRRGRELRADAHRIASAPFPSKHVKAQMREQIAQLAMQGTPDVSMMVEHDGRLIWPMTRLQSEVHAERRLLAFTEVPDTIVLICWLHKDALNAALDREIDAEADDKAALSHEAREKAEVEVRADLLSVERDEIFLCGRRSRKVCRSSTVATSIRSRCLVCCSSPHRALTKYPERRRDIRGRGGDDRSCSREPDARQHVRAARPAGAGCAARPMAPARLPIAPGPPAVSVRSVEAGGPRFLDCLPTIVDRIVAVGGIVAAVRRAGVVAAVVRAAIIAICAACDRATD